jgi:hypothetical protein
MAKPRKESASYTEDDLRVIVTRCVENKAEAGDGGNFKSPHWTALSSELEERRKTYSLKGGERTSKSVKDQWAQVCSYLSHQLSAHLPCLLLD